MKFLFIFYFLFLLGNSVVNSQFSSSLIDIDSAKFQLVVKIKANGPDSITLVKRFSYNIFKIRQADIDYDGVDEILLGTIKSTVLDSIFRKRINIWTVELNKITPKWLGSFLVHPLYDFELSQRNGDTFIITIENEQNDLFLVAEYQWHSFGLKFTRYIKRNICLKEAITLILNPYVPN